MRLKSVLIKNFRAISEVEIELDKHTVLIGTNGVGKSCILKAIERFFAKSAAVSIEDFHDRNVSDPIEVGLTFADLESDELERFSSRVHNGELRVVRVFHSNLGLRENGRYYGFAYRHPDLEEVRKTSGANEKKALYNSLCGKEPFESLEKQSRIVEPHLLGVNRHGTTVLSAFQISGGSDTAWRWFVLDEISNLIGLEETFDQPRTGYNPNDKTMQTIIHSI